MVADWCFVTTLASGTAEAVSKSHPTDTSGDRGIVERLYRRAAAGFSVIGKGQLLSS
jgi:hypothetical protein